MWMGLLINSEDIITSSADQLLLTEQMRHNFSDCKPRPGAESILPNLSRARSTPMGNRVGLALASTTTSETYELKTSKPAAKHLPSFIQSDRRMLGDDPRVGEGWGKPAPDMYLIALESLNSTVDLETGEKPIMPGECLVFEDSVIGVEAGRRAGMRVIWVPHPDLAEEYRPMEKEDKIDDGWAETISSLEHFDFEKYRFDVPC
ncbi:putative HAD superfamily hydrolase [Ustulina deusta]|nr:putative HAD superfamily hydrolase [Ustulina deusta]